MITEDTVHNLLANHAAQGLAGLADVVVLPLSVPILPLIDLGASYKWYIAFPIR